MGPLALIAALFFSAAAPPAPPDPCTNGSFEELAPNGFPLDWEPVGQSVHIVHAVHSGQNALRLLRTPDTKESETGLNRAWKAKSGERGAMIDRLKGGIVFWYKAVSAAEGAKLAIQAIPMNAEPIEQTDSPRAVFAVPKEHIGDGQWHEGRLKYDFTADPKVKWVHFAARILGPAGELLLDDFSYIEQVGPLLRFARVRLDEDKEKPGDRCTITAVIENAGDAVAKDLRAMLTGPHEFRTDAVSGLRRRLGDLAPEARAKMVWTLYGRRTEPLVLPLQAKAGAVEATASIRLAPQLVLEGFGPISPVAAKGQPMPVECRVRNVGNTIVRKPLVEFTLDTEKTTVETEDIPPGQVRVARAAFTRVKEAQEVSGSVVVRAGNAREELRVYTRLLVGSSSVPPAPSGRLRAVSAVDCALLENEYVRLIVRRNEFGFGPGEIQAMTPRGWKTVAWMLHLAPFTYESEDHDVITIGCDGVFAAPPQARNGETACLEFRESGPYDRGNLHVTASFSLRRGEKSLRADCQMSCDEPILIERFGGPTVYVLDREEALYPGLEWLIGDEVSSSALDIAQSHPDRDRGLVLPNMVTIPAIGIRGADGVVGMLWDPHQKWDGTRDRPMAAFESPDVSQGHRSHLFQLHVPNAPEFIQGRGNLTWKHYPLGAKDALRLSCRIVADGSASDVLGVEEEWLRLYGLPEPMPLPHGSYEKEIEFSMQAYLKSLWVPETKEWWTSKGGGRLMSPKGRPHGFVADLLLGAMVSPDEAVRKQCRERAEEMAKLLKIEPRLDAMRFPGRFDLAVADPNHAARVLATMGEDGAWRFDANKEDKGVFKGMDYHELGPDGAVEVGTCARNAYEILRYARVAGDEEAYQRMGKTLRLMETFRVPRAAQVWEVPVHTPDLLAAADAVDVFVEAYRFSGDERWLADAVTWARRGIPFIYLWNPADKPWLLGASIPVYGASWFTCSWFGRPVQWNGLRYATAILKLAEYDRSKDWRRLAELIIRSAILQQDQDGENVALWPDNISAIDGKKCPWVFAPRQIIQNILLLNGRDEEPATTILRRRPLFAGERRVCVTAAAKITDAVWDGGTLSFKAGYPQGEEGVVLVANVERPKAVLVDGKPLAERAEIEKGADPGWRYDEGLAYLSIRVAPADQSPRPNSPSPQAERGPGGEDAARLTPHPPSPSPPVGRGQGEGDGLKAALQTAEDGLRPALQTAGYGLKAALQTKTIRIEGARYRHVDRLPEPADRIAFAFRRSAEGWMAAHDIADLGVRNGALCGRITGGDPYLVRGLLRVRAEDCPVLLIRLRLTAGHGGQFYWTTEASPAFAEDKVLNFEVQADGQWHEYRLEPGRHPLWAGQRITAIRLDPGNGAAAAEFGLEFVRGVGR